MARKAAGLPIGRPRGTPNKLTAKARAALIETFDEIGGVEALSAWARKHRAAFYAIFFKGVPREREANALGTGVTIVVGDGRPVIDVTPERDADSNP